MPLFLRLLSASLLSLQIVAYPLASAANGPALADTDRDGLSDQLEQSLLAQFSPHFMIGRGDCADTPAEFRPGVSNPEVLARNGTIYGQVFPIRSDPGEKPTVEIHFYHLWDRDCGPHGHLLDTEHVAVLARASENDLESANWKALYWYAAAHEHTVCDMSQIARASTLHAENRGATVYVSLGKHASYLDERMCRGGCGADRCEAMTPLQTANLVNIGEVGRPMNGSAFTASAEWPLEAKMSASNFPREALSRVGLLPEGQVALFYPGNHPMRGAIATSLVTGQAITESESETSAVVDNAVDQASGSTGTALSRATDSTGGALHKTYHSTARTLASWTRHLGRALGAKPGDDSSSNQDKPE